MATDSYPKSEMGSIMYKSLEIWCREKPIWPGSGAWALLFPHCENSGKLFVLSEVNLFCKMVIIIVKIIIIRPTFKVVLKVK